MTFAANNFEGLKVDLEIGDLWGARDVSGIASLSRAEVAGQKISDIKLTAAGQGDTSDLDFMGSVRGLALKARGRLTGGTPISLDLASFTAQGASRRIALAGPATLTYDKDGVAIQNFALRMDSGRLSLSGRAGSTLDIRATATAMPLTALDLFSPGLGASGTAEGDATIRGTPSEPSGDWRIRLRQVQLSTNAQQRPAAARYYRIGPARWRTDVDRRRGQCGRSEFNPHHRLGAAVERRTARLEDRRAPRRRARQQRFVCFRPSNDRRAHARASGAGDRREAPGTGVSATGEWRIPRRRDRLQAHWHCRNCRRQR